MSKPILDPEFWRQRIRRATSKHHIVFLCPEVTWQQICTRHRAKLQEIVRDTDSILDVGCGYGRLLELLPATWHGDYLGVDLVDDLVAMGQRTYPNRQFLCADLLEIPTRVQREYDLAVAISMRQMIRANLGEAAWTQRENAVLQRAQRLLVLEYEAEGPEEIIERAHV